MNHRRRAPSVMVVLLAAGALTTGCGAPSPQPPTVIANTIAPTVANPAPSDPKASAEAPGPRRGRHGGEGSSGASTSLPADWPRDLPLPPGPILGSTGSNRRWSVLMLMAGSAADVRKSAVAFYTAAGFTAATDSLLNRGNRHIALAVENRDHSATETNLVIAVNIG